MSSWGYKLFSFPPTPSRKSPPSSAGSDSATSPTRKPAHKGEKMAPSPAAGKSANPKTPTKLARKSQDIAEAAKDEPHDADVTATQVKDKLEDGGGDVPSKIEMKDKTEDARGVESKGEKKGTDDLAEAEPEPIDDDDATAKTGAEEVADDATEKAGDVNVSEDTNGHEENKREEDEQQKEPKDVMSGAKKTGPSLFGRIKKAANRGPGFLGGAAKGDASEAADELQATAGDIQDTAKDTVNGIKDTTDGVASIDLSILDGLEVAEDGLIYDGKTAIGRLTEGDAEDLIGYKVSGNGEILDDDGDLVGVVELLPEKERELLETAKGAVDQSKLPGLEILKGLATDPTGLIYDDKGDTVGQVIEGNPKDLKDLTLNEKGEFIRNGEVVGRAKIHPDYLELLEDQNQTAVDIPQDVIAGEVEEVGDAIDHGADELPGIEALEGKEVGSDGLVRDDEGNIVAEVAEGDAMELKGMTINEKGEVVDPEGTVIGKVQLAEGVEEGLAGLGPDLRILENLKVNKKGKILDSDGEIIGELIDGDASHCAGKRVNARGDVVENDKIIGRVKVVPGDAANEAMKELEKQLGDQDTIGLEIFEGLKVNKKGLILDEDGEPIGELFDGDLEACRGKKCDDAGNVLDAKGKPIGRVRTFSQESKEREELPADAEQEKVEEEVYGGLPPLSTLEGLKCNKAGKLINDKGVIVGELVEGDPKKISRSGVTCDDQGQFWDSKGHVIGRAKTIEIEDAEEEPQFAGLEGLVVVQDGFVEDENNNIVGKIVEGDPKKLVGRAVDEDGDIIDKKGTVVGRAERYEAPEEEEQAPLDLSALEGTTINKGGYAVDHTGHVVGRVVEGDVKDLIGCKVDGMGQIWNSSGKVVGRCELTQDSKDAADGPFASYEGNKVMRDGTVQTAGGDIIGRIIEGDVKRLSGYSVDSDGEITDRNGNVIGRAERWEPEEKERKVSPMSGLRVNKAGELRGPDGEIVGRLTSGDLGQCIGLECDDNGNVVDQDGNIVGGATLIDNIQEEEEEEVDEEEEERREVANKMADICQQTLERIQPVMKQIQEYMERADRTPKDELDEDQLVNDVKPLIEEGHRILNECNGSLRGLDPDGSIAARAKGRAATREASPEEYRLADLLKELTTTVVKTIDDAKKKLSDMPHAKKKLNPLWGLLTEPLFQILAAVGLLLSGVLGLVGRLLNALGLGGLVNGLLGGLGIDKLLGGLGLGSLFESKDKKKKSPASSIPLIGGLLGGGK